jgi:hypothetical protein
MKPSNLQYILAYGFELSAYIPAIVFLAVWVLVNLYRALDLLTNPSELLWFFYIALVAVAGGWVLGGLIIWRFVFFVACKFNGAPFHDGDWVRILRGPHRGRIVPVYEVCKSRHQIRVGLGGQERKEIKDVFMYNQVSRVPIKGIADLAK